MLRAVHLALAPFSIKSSCSEPILGRVLDHGIEAGQVIKRVFVDIMNTIGDSWSLPYVTSRDGDAST